MIGWNFDKIDLETESVMVLEDFVMVGRLIPYTCSRNLSLCAAYNEADVFFCLVAESNLQEYKKYINITESIISVHILLKIYSYIFYILYNIYTSEVISCS